VLENALVGEGTYSEDLNFAVPCRIGKHSVISNLDRQVALDIPGATVIHVLCVLKTMFCARVFQVADNPKKEKFFGSDLVEILACYHISIA
jgi:hypothetical protein